MTLSDPAQAMENSVRLSGIDSLLGDAERAPVQHWFDRLPQSRGDFVKGLRTRENANGRGSGGERVDSESTRIEQAFQEGMAAGRAAAEEEANVKARSARELRLRFGELDSVALESMEGALSSTVLNLCDQLFDDLAIDADLLSKRCRTAAAKLGDAAKGCALHLHPQDSVLISEETSSEWRIVEDEMLERGSLLFESADGSVSDGPAEWRAAIAEAIGLAGTADERQQVQS